MQDLIVHSCFLEQNIFMIQKERIVFVSVFLEIGDDFGERIILCLYFSQNLNVNVELVLEEVLGD